MLRYTLTVPIDPALISPNILIIIATLLGGVLLFSGYLFIRVSIVVVALMWSFEQGMVFTELFMSENPNPLWRWWLVSSAAILLGLCGAAAFWCPVFLAGMSLGWFMSLPFFEGAPLSHILFSVGLGILAVLFERPLIISITSLLGATALMILLALFLSLPEFNLDRPLQEFLRHMLPWWTHIPTTTKACLCLGAAALAMLGARLQITQLRWFMRQSLHKKRRFI